MKAFGNSKVSIDQLLFKTLYYKYRIFLVPIITILVCVLLFFFVVIPQIQSWFSLLDTISTDTQTVQILHQNVTTISAMNDQELTQELATATQALPADKDFSEILQSLQNAATIAGTSLGDYSFALGDLSGTQASVANLPVQLNVLLNGDIQVARRFITQLKNQLPLSDTIAVSANQNQSVTVTVVFYYAPLPKIQFQEGQLLPGLTTSQQKLLAQLQNNNAISSVVLASPSAGKAVPLVPSVTPTGTARPVQ